MLIEGTVVKCGKLSRVVCAEINKKRVFIHRDVFEDFGSIVVGTELSVECFENEEEKRLIATAVTVLRWPTAEDPDATEQELHAGYQRFQDWQQEYLDQTDPEARGWRYRTTT